MTEPEGGSPVKRCTHCGEEKPLDEFYRDRSSPDGRAWWCKTCTRARGQKYRAQRRETPNTVLKSRWVAIRCEVCGKEMRYRRSEIESRQRRGRPLPRFCSRRCATRDQHRRRREAL